MIAAPHDDGDRARQGNGPFEIDKGRLIILAKWCGILESWQQQNCRRRFLASRERFSMTTATDVQPFPASIRANALSMPVRLVLNISPSSASSHASASPALIERGAVEAAVRTFHTRARGQRKGGDPEASKTKIKFDRQIVAIATVEGTGRLFRGQRRARLCRRGRDGSF